MSQHIFTTDDFDITAVKESRNEFREGPSGLSRE